MGTELRKIGRVLGARWVASSYQSLLAIWSSYNTLYAHSSESSSLPGNGKHKSTYHGIRQALQFKELLHSPAVMLDALKEVSKLSKALQADNCSLSKTYQLLRGTIKALQNQKEGHGSYFQEYLCAETAGNFRGIKLLPRESMLCKEAFLQAIIDNLSTRFDENVGVTSNVTFNRLLTSFDVLDS